jgi:hypothetical protein
MTPKEHKQMMQYLLRKDTKTPEQRAKINKQNDLKEKKRLLAKRKEYGVDTSSLQQLITKTEDELKIDKDPNIFRRIKYYGETYDDTKFPKELDDIIKKEDDMIKKAATTKPFIKKTTKTIPQSEVKIDYNLDITKIREEKNKAQKALDDYEQLVKDQKKANKEENNKGLAGLLVL